MTTTTDKQLIAAGGEVSFYVGQHRATEALAITDLCDYSYCPKFAKFRYRDPVTGLDLDFCRHHSDRKGPQLDELGWRIVSVAL